MATADPASSTCEDAPCPGPRLSECFLVWRLFLIYGRCRAHAGTAAGTKTGAPIPVPLLLIAGDVKHKACLLPASHALLPQRNARTVKVLSEWRIFLSISRGGEEEAIIEQKGSSLMWWVGKVHAQVCL